MTTSTTRGRHVEDFCDRCGKLRQTIPHDHQPTDDWAYVRKAAGRICRTCNRELRK